MVEGKPDDDPYIALARIGRPRGVKGEFYIWLLADNLERFNDLKKVYLVRRSERMPTELETFHVVSGKTVIKVRGIETPEEAKLWTGGFLEIDEADRINLPESVYFQDQIVGLNVISEDGTHLGTIEKVMEMPANHVYACRTTDGREVLIPAVEDAVKKIDVKAGEMIVSLLPGLFD
jgi:16S rRNA processing protein RimM